MAAREYHLPTVGFGDSTRARTEAMIGLNKLTVGHTRNGVESSSLSNGPISCQDINRLVTREKRRYDLQILAFFMTAPLLNANTSNKQLRKPIPLEDVG